MQILLGAVVLLATIAQPVVVTPPACPDLAIPPAVSNGVEAEKLTSDLDDGAVITNDAESCETASPDELLGTVVSVAATCSRCPSGTPQCWSDKSCDDFCGGRVSGSCVRINSCYKCCACAY